MKKCFLVIYLFFVFIFLTGCSGKQQNNFPDCEVPLEHMNNEMTIQRISKSYELHQPIVIKLSNNTINKITSDPSDFKIVIFKKSEKQKDWTIIDNSSNSLGSERRIINSNSSVYFGFYPDLLGIDEETEVYVCIYANISDSQGLIGVSGKFLLN